VRAADPASFRSPWRFRPFALAVALLRRLLRSVPACERAFLRRLVAAHNGRIAGYLARVRVRTVLLILPRCLKRRGCRCDVRPAEWVVSDAGSEPLGLTACASCDLCPLGPIARLTRHYGVRALVAFRSHIAFAIARQERPDLILATACEDRLIKALRSVPEVPALLSPLTGMERPCVNAACDLGWFERQLQAICGRDSPEHSPRSTWPPVRKRSAEGA
jgi:hypothetical protein